VYDTIKVIDSQNAIGVMHLGTFPDGLEFATFVMARNNYPFENMSLEDHQRLFADPHNTIPAITNLAGSWSGRLVLVPTTANTLLNQISPVLFDVAFTIQGQQATAQYRIGPADFSQTLDTAALQTDFRVIDANTILGKCIAPQIPALASVLTSFSQPDPGGAALCFLLNRGESAPAAG
jgi:hypothetical protein